MGTSIHDKFGRATHSPGKFQRLAGLGIVLCLLVLVASGNARAGSWANGLSLGGFNAVNVYTPDSVSPVGQGRSLLIVLHGCTQSINAFNTANLEDAAEDFGMVIAVPDAVNKAGFSCWSYWQGAVSRTSGDYRNLIGLANALSGDSARGIDPDQVYIAGLSSGATFAAQTACVAPDVFAGVAPSAGPTIGTSSSGAIGTCETVSPDQFRSRCEGWAGLSLRDAFDTQVAVVGHGTQDTTVDLCYNEQNARGYARLYGVERLTGEVTTITEGARTAEQHLWSDQRVAMLWLNGLTHAWSGGEGASGSFIGSQSINFATYLGAYFAANNKRVSRNQAPVIEALDVIEQAGRLEISARAVDPDGTVDVVTAVIERLDAVDAVEVQRIDGAPAADGGFTAVSMDLPDALYRVRVFARDDQGEIGDPAVREQRIGPPPPASPPQIGALTATVDGQCATVRGDVFDANQDLESVSVEFSLDSVLLDTVPANRTGGTFEASRCALPGGTLGALAVAIDAAGLEGRASVTFEIDAGQTGDTNFHIDRGHIEWGFGYAECFLAFGTAEFTMRETATADGQCRWVADGDASCRGPVQPCSDAGDNDPPPAPDPDPDPDPDPAPDPACTEHTTQNYLHRAAGRAYSSGFFWAPDYFASGSDDPMPGSTYGTNTLSSTDGEFWSLGGCSVS